MSKKKKIVLGVVIVAAACCCVLFGVWKSGYFKDSNYSRLDTDKYITLAKYKGLKYTKPTVSVTDEEVQEEIQSRVSEKATDKKVKTGTVAEGDTITISYVGKINGKTFDGGSATNSTITVGEAGLIDGFESGLIGKNVGDTVTLNLTFPDDYYNTDVAGKDVVFEVTINSKTVTETPEYNLAFVKKYTKYNSIAAYEKAVKKELLKEKKDSAMDSIKEDLWQKVVDNTKVKKYPSKQIAYEKKSIRSQYKQEAENYGVTLKSYLSMMGVSQKKFNKMIKSYAKSVVKQKLVLTAIAKKEDIKVTNKEYKQRLKKMLKSAGFTESTFEDSYGMTIEEYAEENDLKMSMLLEEVSDKILDEAKVKKTSSES